MLPQVVAAGMRVMRINFSHATYDEANLRMTNLQKHSPGLGGKANLRAVMLDTQGPEIRTGSFGTDGSLDMTEGNKVVLTTDESFRTTQTEDKLWISYKELGTWASLCLYVCLCVSVVYVSVRFILTPAFSPTLSLTHNLSPSFTHTHTHTHTQAPL